MLCNHLILSGKEMLEIYEYAIFYVIFYISLPAAFLYRNVPGCYQVLLFPSQIATFLSVFLFAFNGHFF